MSDTACWPRPPPASRGCRRHERAPSATDDVAPVLIGLAISWPIVINIVLPAIPAIGDAFGTTPDRVQFAFSMGMMAFGFAQFVIGPMIDRFGRRPVMLAALVIFCTGSNVGALAPGMPVVTLGRVVQCAGVAALFVIARVIIRDLYKGARAGQAMSRLATSITVGPMVTPILGGIIVSALGWRYTFGFAALYALALLAWCWRSAGETQPQGERGGMSLAVLKTQYRVLFTDPVFISYVLAATCISNGFFTVMLLTPVLFIKDFGVSPAVFGFCVIGMTCGLMAGGFHATRRVMRLGVDGIIARGLTVSSLALLLLALTPWPSLPLVIIPACLYMYGHGMAFPNSMAASTDVDPRVVGAATATLASVSQLLIGLLTSVSARWHDGTGLPLATICLASNLLAWAAFTRARRLKAERRA
ncbi:MAG: multidrug effflux MFS transporter [Betaproteobacteria bacterium]|nr:multidrug effflux MFS transporter [Betaproteobacteria bacterium]